ncbi:MAG: hypothetical protein IJ037_10130, partial [Clostridia bacterium]|nr:hypothetical protein [Clostridia bacterium]
MEIVHQNLGASETASPIQPERIAVGKASVQTARQQKIVNVILECRVKINGKIVHQNLGASETASPIQPERIAVGKASVQTARQQ